MRDIIRCAFLDDHAELLVERLFGVPFQPEIMLELTAGTLIIRPQSDPDVLLEQLTIGDDSSIDVVLLDVDFSHSVRAPLLVDPPGMAFENYLPTQLGMGILKTIKRIDPDLPVVMLTVLDTPEASFAAGQEAADAYLLKSQLEPPEPGMSAAREFMLDQLWNQIAMARAVCRRRAIYDHEHLATANTFAKEYDAGERSKLATVAYYHYENDLIGEQVDRLMLSADSSRRLRILDLGCGTGRIEEMLAERRDRGRIEVVAVDFAERMIRMAAQKFGANPCIAFAVGHSAASAKENQLSVALFRAPAERVRFLGQRFADGFDMAILGFGFLSYVKYVDVLPACPQKPPTTGVVPLLREGAPLLFSVYNEHSAIYDRIAQTNNDEQELPIAALMDLSDGRLKVGQHYIACEAFTPSRIIRFLKQGGLAVDPDVVRTFPTAHLLLNNSEQLPDDKRFPPGKFDARLFELDRQLSNVICHRGHYIVGIARKTSHRYVASALQDTDG